MALRREIIDFVGTHQGDDLDETHGVAHVCIVKVKVRTPFEVSDAFAEIHGGASDGAMHLIAFLKKKLGEEGTVLSRDACDECFFHSQFLQ